MFKEQAREKRRDILLESLISSAWVDNPRTSVHRRDIDNKADCAMRRQ